jgi:UTP-glucose-1-phosphate uridylyltransferase
MKPTLVIMAAGMGSRYGGLKQIDKIGPGGEIVIDYSIFDAIRAGFGKVVFIIRKDIEEAFREVVEPNLRGRIPFAYVHQELAALPPGFSAPPDRKKPWGTTHAILQCRGAVNEPFGVINADDFYGRNSFQLLADTLKNRPVTARDYALIAFRIKNTLSAHGSVSRGVCEVDARKRLQKIVERIKIERRGGRIEVEIDQAWQPLEENTPVSMNMWGFTPAIFEDLERDFCAFLEKQIGNLKSENYIPGTVDNLIQLGRASVEVLDSPDAWLGMTYPEDKPAVGAGIRQLIAAGQYPERLWT